MKKLSAFLLIFSLIFTACGDTSSPEETTLIPFISQNGYELTYPDTLSPASLSSDIDFVVMDDITGSSVTVMTENAENAGGITKEAFREEKRSEGMDITITAFEQKEINGLPAYEVTYKYNENTVTEIVYVTEEHIYRATYTELPGTSDKLRGQMTAIITSLCA